MNAIYLIGKNLETFEKKLAVEKSRFTKWKFSKFLKWHDENKTCHGFVSCLRLKRYMSLIQHELDSPGLVNYFSYPHHDQKVRNKILEPLEGKNLFQRWGKLEISRWSDQIENSKFVMFFTFSSLL